MSDLMDCSLPGSSVHGSFQARVLEWDAIAFSDTHIYNIQTYKLYIKREREISFSNWLPKLWELAGVKSGGLAIRLETRAGFLGCNLETEIPSFSNLS